MAERNQQPEATLHSV